mmetsp:Transcript_24038/g.52088  ORF Transcript_24038/g.52088 Transcript_24038/m.52088 type:complete len:211 (+) Transcript_24038:159-791(+)
MDPSLQRVSETEHRSASDEVSVDVGLVDVECHVRVVRGPGEVAVFEVAPRFVDKTLSAQGLGFDVCLFVVGLGRDASDGDVFDVYPTIENEVRRSVAVDCGDSPRQCRATLFDVDGLSHRQLRHRRRGGDARQGVRRLGVAGQRRVCVSGFERGVADELGLGGEAEEVAGGDVDGGRHLVRLNATDSLTAEVAPVSGVLAGAGVVWYVGV